MPRRHFLVEPWPCMSSGTVLPFTRTCRASRRYCAHEEPRLQERRMGRDNAAIRQMTLVAFLQAANCSNYPASWRHPATAPDFLTAAYFQRIARTLEEGKFHLAFCEDRL